MISYVTAVGCILHCYARMWFKTTSLALCAWHVCLNIYITW